MSSGVIFQSELLMQQIAVWLDKKMIRKAEQFWQFVPHQFMEKIIHHMNLVISI